MHTTCYINKHQGFQTFIKTTNKLFLETHELFCNFETEQHGSIRSTDEIYYICYFRSIY